MNSQTPDISNHFCFPLRFKKSRFHCIFKLLLTKHKIKKSYFNYLVCTTAMLFMQVTRSQELNYANNLLYCREFDCYVLSIAQVTTSACVKRCVFPVFLYVWYRNPVTIIFKKHILQTVPSQNNQVSSFRCRD